jgi:hypothetical protein
MSMTLEEAIEVSDREIVAVEFDVSRLSEVSRHIYLINSLNFELANGRPTQWLINSSGEYAAETLESLRAVGAIQVADQLQRILDTFPASTPPKDESERTLLVLSLEASCLSTWQHASDRILQWPDDVDSLLRAFLAKH